MFWEPDVDCNLASAWLSSALKVLGPLVESGDHVLLAKTLGQHRPSLGPLWLGAILTGSAPDVAPLLRTLCAPYARPDSLASAWLGISQLFMDICSGRPYEREAGYIARADRWRLLHDLGSEPYCSTPLSSWQPFGLTSSAQDIVDTMLVGIGLHKVANRLQALYRVIDI